MLHLKFPPIPPPTFCLSSWDLAHLGGYFLIGGGGAPTFSLSKEEERESELVVSLESMSPFSTLNSEDTLPLA